MTPAATQSVSDLLRQLSAHGVIPGAPHAHVRWWFRGQSKPKLPLRPGVYRPSFTAADEADRLRRERHMAQEFRVESAGLRSGQESDAELYFLQQHYRMSTRLLDWSTSLDFHGGSLP
jgi:FRG domain